MKSIEGDEATIGAGDGVALINDTIDQPARFARQIGISPVRGNGLSFSRIRTGQANEFLIALLIFLGPLFVCGLL